jgi:hypothetical protein
MEDDPDIRPEARLEEQLQALLRRAELHRAELDKLWKRIEELEAAIAAAKRQGSK